jgi:hypothetical protein
MTKQIINIGSGPLAGDGEGLYSAFNKINQNFGEVYSATSNIPTDVSQLTDTTHLISSAYTLHSATVSTLGGVKIGSNVNVDANGVISVAPVPTNVSAFFNDAGYLTTNTFNNLGNLTIVDQTITGNDANGDIVLNPNGAGSISVPSLRIPVGSLISGSSQIIANIAVLVLSSVVDSSSNYDTAVALTVGQYGIPNGIAAPWTVYRFTTTPSPILQVNDIIAGAGIPINSSVVYVGSGPYSTYVITNTAVVKIAPPINGELVTTARAIVNAGFSIQTKINTDITLNAGSGGNIVPHSDILPYTTNQWRLGSPAQRFKEIWLGTGTIYIQDETLGVDTAIGARDGIVYIEGGIGLRVGQFTFQNNNIFLGDPTSDINIGSSGATGFVNLNRPLKIQNSTGRISFVADRTGRVQIYAPGIPAGDIGAFSIIGNSSNSYQTLVSAGGMIHVTGNDGSASRIVNDAYGTNSVAVFTGRSARGTAASPSQLLANDVALRISAAGYMSDVGFGIANSVSSMAIELQALENLTSTTQGAQWNFYVSPIGQGIKQLTLSVNATTGLIIPHNGTGVRFPDGSFQTTAWTGSMGTTMVNSIIAGAGLYQSGTTGNITIDATGVQNVYGTQSQIYVSDSGSKNLTLSLPQNIDSTANPTFNNLTVNNLIVNGTSTVNTSSTIAGKILYLASGSTQASQINGGGIILGSSPFAQQILYNLTNNYWDLNAAGLNAQAITASNGTFSGGLRVASANSHFGTAYQGSDYLNASIQIDENANSYIQLVQQNHSNGTNASSDFVASNNLSDDNSYFIDMGINSSNYNGTSVGWTVSGANDSYLYNANGNLTIGTSTASKTISFHTGGTLSTNIRATISDTGMNVAGSVTAIGFTGSVYGSVIGNVTGNVTGNVSGNAGTVTHGVYTTDTGSVTNTMLAGSIANNKLTNSSVTVIAGTGLSGGGTVALGNSIIISNIDGGSQQNIFKNIAVTGQGTVTAIANNDTVTFTAGSGVSMTTSGSTITVSSTVPIGYTGSRGYLGSIGAQGIIGYTGSFGNTGYTGSQGVQGIQGVTGYAGSQGIAGNNGYSGSIGYAGSQGVGFAGSQGVQGTTGFTGSFGSAGYSGSQGVQGTTGFTGSFGATGFTGSFGAAGFTGSIGIGFAGSQGYAGSQGPQGAQGTNTTLKGSVATIGALPASGNTVGDGYIVTASGHLYIWNGSAWTDVGIIVGPTGYTGSSYTGSQGATGYVGSQGTTGYVGSQGTAGFTGSQGVQGTTGFTGSFGATGFTGSFGATGFTGSFGATGFTGSFGATGYVGSQGNLGFVGSFGFAGSVGYAGSQGYYGSFGYTGSQGVVGYTGSFGSIGYTGSIGPNVAATTSTLGSVIVSTGLSVTGGGTLTNAGVTSNIAGLGIGVSAGTGNVTISNNGVLAINGYTGSISGVITSSDTGTVTNTMLAGSIANNKLTNSSVTVGSTSISLGGTATTIAGLTSVTSTTFVGNVTGNVSGTAATITGTYNGSLTSSQVTTALGFAPLQTAVTSLTGTANQITVSASTGSVTLSLPNSVIMPGELTLAAGTNSIQSLQIPSGVLLTNAAAGAVEYDGDSLYFTPSGTQRGIIKSPQLFVLNANYTLANQSSTQSLFGKGVTLTGGNRYYYRILYTVYLSNGSRTNSAIQYALALTNGAALAQHTYWVNPCNNSLQTTPTQTYQMSNHITTGFNTLISISNTGSGSQYYSIIIDGNIDCTSTGTITPQFGLSSSTPGSSSYIQAGATMEIYPIGPQGANTSVGTWA